MIDGCDESFSVYRPAERRRSKKDRQCHECRRPISAGEHYWNAAGLYDSQWDTSVVCEHCHVACEWLSKNCGSWLFHGVFEDIEEHTQEYRNMGLVRLLAGMKRKWVRFHKPGLLPVPRLPKPLALGDHH